MLCCNGIDICPVTRKKMKKHFQLVVNKTSREDCSSKLTPTNRLYNLGEIL